MTRRRLVFNQRRILQLHLAGTDTTKPSGEGSDATHTGEAVSINCILKATTFNYSHPYYAECFVRQEPLAKRNRKCFTYQRLLNSGFLLNRLTVVLF
jgi:hypothetical protein